ncbi:helix-turn-helix domain-containing protein [Clostridium butyricum]|uniref:helix-turn-helix domain-containing protein n=1 Tax=Clostridium butyricum TaxID=1492 RepID=UPI0018ABA746|nr:helix-turn-helix transcriptional regulator [Clostridium butyricum]
MQLLGLKQIRKIFGFTMRDLAKLLDVSANAINLWENGGVDVPESRLNQLSIFFDLNKEIFLKNQMNTKDLMHIEFARSRYKMNEYKQLMGYDNKVYDDIVSETKEEYIKDWQKTDWETLENRENYICLKTLISKLIKVYSVLNCDDYDDCDSYLREVLDSIVNKSKGWEYFEILWDSLKENCDVEDSDKDFIIYCEKEDILERNIRKNVYELFKLKKFKDGTYTPEE